MVQKIYSKMHPVLCTNTHHDVTDLVNHGMVKNTKTWISWKRNIIFLRNKKILNQCLRWHILRSYRFLAEVTFKIRLVTLPLPFYKLKVFLKWFGQFLKQRSGYFFIILFYFITWFLNYTSILPFLNSLRYFKLFESELISVKDGG